MPPKGKKKKITSKSTRARASEIEEFDISNDGVPNGNRKGEINKRVNVSDKEEPSNKKSKTQIRRSTRQTSFNSDSDSERRHNCLLLERSNRQFLF